MTFGPESTAPEPSSTGLFRLTGLDGSAVLLAVDPIHRIKKSVAAGQYQHMMKTVDRSEALLRWW